ncbi:MAG: trehalose-6-phosphate synthase [Phycisphaerales bacterium]|nr:trehalose-6-phosphate synthase [Phycisphaerales bacterium]
MRKDSRLIVVANRLPVQRVGRGSSARWERSSGGLVTAMSPILRRHAGVWIGWTGNAGRAPAPFTHERLMIRPIGLSEREVHDYYQGFCNRTIWPLFHDALRPPEFQRDRWDCYIEINRRFARAAARSARRGDIIWVHDYQLLLAPRMIRELRRDIKIGFFLHIPFPPEELFAWLPWRQAVVRGLLGADLVGFQTFSDAQNFSRAARRYAPAEGTDTEITCENRRIRINAFPISIDFRDFERRANQSAVVQRARQIRQRIGPERRIMLAVDRLDYTKGIESRLRAFEDLLERKLIRVEDCVLIQIAVPSRENVTEYQEMRMRIEQTVGRINGEFSQPGHVAVHYFRRSVTPDDLSAYYRAADVMLVTPLRDGMNLVAKEYVATRTDYSGVLVLSEFAGAARELRRALLVNPHDIQGVAATILQALRLPRDEARKRMMILRMIVRRHDVYDWAEKFLEALER